MTDEDKAFIDAYISCFGASSREFVEKVLTTMHRDIFEEKKSIVQRYGSEAIKVLDAYVLWCTAIKYGINMMKKT